ncbi:MAG: protoheme IX farnesyltransferase [Planctomycetales bacterium 12-60-4]|nr:MAG: protoheme IX farnesyltransferase [Planctomycetales bacterium 12-60-4]
MSTAADAPPRSSSATSLDSVWPMVSARIADYVSLSRPGIALMVLVTVTVGYLLGQQGAWVTATLFHAWLGITLVAAGSSAVNQWFERETDSLMNRTRDRALPAKRLFPIEVLLIGNSCALFGCIYLALTVNLLTAALTGLTFVLYAGVYTPLKRWTSLCTAVGAIPGALPPVLGWTAAGQSLDLTAFALFGLLFFWQFPHFLAIAWLHREDYLSAGLRMLPGGRPLPRVTGLMATAYALGLVPISLVPAWLGVAGNLYAVTAILGGLVYIAAAIGFAHAESRQSARRVLWASLIYLPLVLAVLAADHVRLLQ